MEQNDIKDVATGFMRNLEIAENNELIKKLAQTHEWVKSKEYELSKISHELDLLKKDEFNQLRDIHTFVYLSILVSGSEASDGVTMRSSGLDKDGKKLDKRRKYPQLDALKHVETRLAKELGLSSIEIQSISKFNWGEGTFVRFLCPDQSTAKFELYVPNCHEVSYESYERYGDWFFKAHVSYYEGTSVTQSVGSTYVPDDLPELMQKAIKAADEL